MRRLLILPLLLGVPFPTNIVHSAEVNCESQVWRNKEICIEKRRKKEQKPIFCDRKDLTPIQEEECLNFEEKRLEAINKPLEYPISFGLARVAYYRMTEFLPPNEERATRKYKTNRILQLRSKDGSNLVIDGGWSSI